MARKKKEPEFIPSRLNTPMLNYRVYYMDKGEKILNFLGAFVVGGICGLIFYGNQFLDEEGFATQATTICNIVTFVVIGIIAGLAFIPIREKGLRDSRIDELTLQFQSFLSALSVALSSGMNMTESLSSAYHDLKLQFSENAYIVKEVEEMMNGLHNGIDIEEMMTSLGNRSNNPDIQNFGLVFSMCFRTGGNLKDVVRRTSDIISEKIAIGQEIETALTSNKTQFDVMMLIPVVLVLMLRMMSSSFAKGFSSPVGVIAITIAIGLFFAAYKMGQKIMDVKG